MDWAMRELSFRAYLSKEKKMSNEISMWEIPYVFDKGFPEDCKLMQFTGLVDKNGKIFR